jgi:hypothetical protein
MAKSSKHVKSTNNISFDEHFKTFRLYAGKSLYAFSITAELSLEHLYWGKSLPVGYDLRYLSQINRYTHFTTVEAAPIASFNSKVVVEAETLDEIQKTWRENRSWVPLHTNDADYIARKRLENYSWRMMTKMAQHPKQEGTTPGKPGGGKPRGQSWGSASYSPGKENEQHFNEHHHDGEHSQLDDHETADKKPAAAQLRGRSASTPALVNEYMQIKDPKATTSQQQAHHQPSPIDEEAFAFEERVSPSVPTKKSVQTFERKLGLVGKGVLCVEYTDYGTGDFRSPSFIAIDHSTGSAISPLRYRSHKIYRGKLPFDEMPSIRCEKESDASTLVVTLVDSVTGLEIDLIYGEIVLFILFLPVLMCSLLSSFSFFSFFSLFSQTVAMHNYDCIVRRAVFRNTDSRKMPISGGGVSSKLDNNGMGSNKVIQKASSITIDFESSYKPFHLVQLSGR